MNTDIGSDDFDDDFDDEHEPPMKIRTEGTKYALFGHATEGAWVRIDGVRLQCRDASQRVFVMLPKDTHSEAKGVVEAVVRETIDDALHKVIAGVVGEEIAGTVRALLPDSDYADVPTFLSDGDDSRFEYQRGHWVLSAEVNARKVTFRDRTGANMYDYRVNERTFDGKLVNILIRPWMFSGLLGMRGRVRAAVLGIQSLDDGVKQKRARTRSKKEAT